MRRTRRAERARAGLREPREWYCIYFAVGIPGRPRGAPVVDTTQHDPFTSSELFDRIRHPAYVSHHPWPKDRLCPPYDRSACQKQAETFVRPLQQLLGWKRPPPPEPPTIGPAAALRPRPPRRAGLPTTPQLGVPGLPPTEPERPELGRYVCTKNPAFNQVNCYDIATSILVWSNYQTGPWKGTPAPKGAPFGAGTGA